MIKEFSIFFLAATAIVSFASTTVTCAIPFPALLLTPSFPLSLLSIPNVITCFSYQPLPPLLLIPSPFFLWHMLSAKSKFFIDIVPIANHDRSSEFASSFASIESASSFTSHVHKSHKEINDKVA